MQRDVGSGMESAFSAAVKSSIDDRRRIRHFFPKSVACHTRIWLIYSPVVGGLLLLLWRAPTTRVYEFSPSSLDRPLSDIPSIDASSYGEKQNTSSKRRTIVVLTVGRYIWEPFTEGREEFLHQKCPITDCWITSDREKYKETADALLLMIARTSDIKKYLPKPSHQIWIVRHHESPREHIVDPFYLKNLVNWTITYRRDATIQVPYGYMTPLHQPKHQSQAGRSPEQTHNYATGKTKKIAWFVSNCGLTTNGRTNYVAELNKYIDVDTYGKCGKFKCRQQCFKMVQESYKFYLSFENSNCKDYISEKVFHNAFKHNVVPIVMGARPEDYADLLPPHSYIHVDDFRSPRDLATYLLKLDANDTLYNEYFRWKRDWQVTQDKWITMWCRLCGLLHAVFDGRSPYVHWYRDYASWWIGACDAQWVKRNSYHESWQTWKNETA